MPGLAPSSISAHHIHFDSVIGCIRCGSPVGRRVRLTIERKALEELAAIEPPKQRKAIRDAIFDLGLDPRPSGCTKLTDTPGYRIRVGGYRVIYVIDDGIRVITVTKIGTRGDVYKRKRSTTTREPPCGLGGGRSPP